VKKLIRYDRVESGVPTAALRLFSISLKTSIMAKLPNAGRLVALALNRKLNTASSKIIAETATLMVVNSDAAAAVGVTLPDDLLQTAAIIYKGGQASTPAAAVTKAADTDDALIKARTCSADELAATAAATQSK
jgi:hypothetical protein